MASGKEWLEMFVVFFGGLSFLAFTFSAKGEIENSNFINSRIKNIWPFLIWAVLMGIIIIVGYVVHTRRHRGKKYKQTAAGVQEVTDDLATCEGVTTECKIIDGDSEQSLTRTAYLIKTLLLYGFALAYVVNKFSVGQSGGNWLQETYYNLFKGKNFIFMVILIIIIVNVVANLYMYTKNQYQLNDPKLPHHSFLRADYMSNISAIFGMLVTYIFVLGVIKPPETLGSDAWDYSLDSKYGAVFRALLFGGVFIAAIVIIQKNKCDKSDDATFLGTPSNEDKEKCGGFLGIRGPGDDGQALDAT